MLDIKLVRQHPQRLREALGHRGLDLDLDGFLALDEKRRAGLQRIETLRHRRNVVSEEIARMKKAGRAPEALMAEMREVGATIKSLEADLAEAQQELDQFLLTVPNKIGRAHV